MRRALRHIQEWMSSTPTVPIALGALVVLAASLMELLRGRAENFGVFCDATQQFWQGISPYTQDFELDHERYFLYTPVFTVLFAPMALMPRFIGGVVWNLLGYGLICSAVMMMHKMPTERKPYALWWLLLFMGQTAFCFQYNMLVAGIYLMAYVLLEKDRAPWAILLIMVSATTKVIGIAELALLICYPKFWRNIGYAVLWGLVLLALPMVVTGWDGFADSYANWWGALARHESPEGSFYSLLTVQPLRGWILPHMRAVQAGVMAVVAVLFLTRPRHQWYRTKYKTGLLAAIMIYIILWNDAAEFTSYTIAAAGLATWYYIQKEHHLVDRIGMTAIWVLFGVMPIDILCPPAITHWVHATLRLGVWVMTAMWIWIIGCTVHNARCTVHDAQCTMHNENKVIIDT